MTPKTAERVVLTRIELSSPPHVAADAAEEGLDVFAEARAVAVEEKDDEGDERELQERVAHVHGRSEDGAHDGFQSLLQGVAEGVGIQNGYELLVKPVAHHRDFGDPGGKLKARGDPGAKKLHGLGICCAAATSRKEIGIRKTTMMPVTMSLPPGWNAPGRRRGS